MRRKRVLTEVEEKIRKVLGTDRFLLTYVGRENTMVMSGGLDMWERYGLMRLTETILDNQCCILLRKSAEHIAKEAGVKAEDTHA